MLRSALVLLLIVSVPYLLEFAFRKEYKVYSEGVILISGTSSGIGRHAVFELAKHNFTVIAGVRKQQDIDSLNEEAKKLKLEKRVVPILLDVSKDGSITESVKTVTEFLKSSGLPFIALVNNAGIGGRSPLESMNIENSKYIFDVNYWGSISLTQAYLPFLRKNQGRVLFVSSVQGFVATYGSTAYAGSKHAMEAAVDALRLEMDEFGVSVSSIQPGYIDTNIKDSGMTDPKKEVTEEQYQVYKKFWDRFQQDREKNFASGASPAVTSEAILDAIVNPFPKTRYPVGPTGTFSASQVSLLKRFLPDRLADSFKKGK
eukprot:TRINITY_DN4685_c0_g1_i1.p1 TRINITY_DN4685_c0_g1~~TRINITY_DN4685_c0_g1_i1.p1  ORF type:complete len:316 (+),score=67.35 TRINITY_DN4685_c0_g1_i1:15-962(+)